MGNGAWQFQKNQMTGILKMNLKIPRHLEVEQAYTHRPIV